MTTYKTGSPLGSSAAKDLFDNAQNFDNALNAKVMYWIDRLGVQRITEYGRNELFNQLLQTLKARGDVAIAAIGWQELGDWALGLVFSERSQIVLYDGSWYKFLGDLPHTISGDSPSNDGGIWSSTNTEGLWVNIGDAALRTELAAKDAFKLLGSVASFAELRTVLPEQIGQKIFLRAHTDGWAAQNKAPVGGGIFTAFNSAATDDGGTIAVVNPVVHWRREFSGPYQPEFFGAQGDESADDAPAIRLALAAADKSGVKWVEGYGEYLINSMITLPFSTKSSPSGLSGTAGFTLSLNSLSCNADTWDAVPAQWWNATPAFRPTYNTDGFTLAVQNFDGGGKAHFIDTVGTSLSTSRIDVKFARNYVLVFRNYLGMTKQGTMNYITGENWQDGYAGVLIGGSGRAATSGANNGECHNVDVQWLANNRYGGASMQDRSQYAQIKGGTWDFNGTWLSQLTLTNLSSTGPTDIQFGDEITVGATTRYAASSVMHYKRSYILLVQENSSRLNGASDFNVGDTISCGTWSATISAIELTAHDDATGTYRYYDIIDSNKTGDFSKSTFMPTYLGGIRGHNGFTNVTISPNSSETVDAVNIRGWGIAGGATSSVLYIPHLYLSAPPLVFYEDQLQYNIPVVMGGNGLYGIKASYDAVQGVAREVLTFPAAASELRPDIYDVIVSSSFIGQNAVASVRVGTSGAALFSVTQDEAILSVNGLTLSAQTGGGGDPSVITITSTKRT